MTTPSIKYSLFAATDADEMSRRLGYVFVIISSSSRCRSRWSSPRRQLQGCGVLSFARLYCAPATVRRVERDAKRGKFWLDPVRLERSGGFSAALAWYPRLSHGSNTERGHWRFIGEGEGIHWPDLDKDISVEDLLAGRRSGESQASLGRSLANRRTG